MRSVLCGTFLGFLMVATASAGPIDIGTANAANWLISAPSMGIVNHAAYGRTDGSISITDTATRLGNCDGCDLSQFDGLWTAAMTFSLPSNFTNPVLIFSGFKADDRAVLLLNGVAIGDYSLDGVHDCGATGMGDMALTDTLSRPIDSQYVFSRSSATITSGFVAGANTLRLIVNNTGIGQLQSPTENFIANGDSTGAMLTGTVTYSTSNPVPEPSSVGLLLTGLAPLGYYLTRRRRL